MGRPDAVNSLCDARSCPPAGAGFPTVSRMPGLFSVFRRAGRLPPAVRAQLEPERIIVVAERVRVRQRFSGSIPGRRDAASRTRHLGVLAVTGERLYALVPSAPRLAGPLIDHRWDAPQQGAATVALTGAGVQLDIAIAQVDPRFHGELSMTFAVELADDVLARLPARSMAFEVPSATVFHLLGVRAR
jgi:hypothetical protein